MLGSSYFSVGSSSLSSKLCSASCGTFKRCLQMNSVFSESNLFRPHAGTTYDAPLLTGRVSLLGLVVFCPSNSKH